MTRPLDLDCDCPSCGGRGTASGWGPLMPGAPFPGFERGDFQKRKCSACPALWWAGGELIET